MLHKSFLPYIQYTVIRANFSTELIQRQSILFIQAFKVVKDSVQDKPVIQQKKKTTTTANLTQSSAFFSNSITFFRTLSEVTKTPPPVN